MNRREKLRIKRGEVHKKRYNGRVSALPEVDEVLLLVLPHVRVEYNI
jgi:hypothetical protein